MPQGTKTKGRVNTRMFKNKNVLQNSGQCAKMVLYSIYRLKFPFLDKSRSMEARGPYFHATAVPPTNRAIGAPACRGEFLIKRKSEG